MNPIPLSRVTKPAKYQTGSAARIHNDNLKPVCARLQNKLITTCTSAASPARDICFSASKSRVTQLALHIRCRNVTAHRWGIGEICCAYWKQQGLCVATVTITRLIKNSSADYKSTSPPDNGLIHSSNIWRFRTSEFVWNLVVWTRSQ